MAIQHVAIFVFFGVIAGRKTSNGIGKCICLTLANIIVNELTLYGSHHQSKLILITSFYDAMADQFSFVIEDNTQEKKLTRVKVVIEISNQHGEINCSREGFAIKKALSDYETFAALDDVSN
jgi:hypothetical protein